MKKLIAKDLLDIQAVFLKPQDPFTWASGIKSPIYCDNRLTLSYPKVREDVENALAEIIRNEYPTCNMVMGTSTACIAHAAIVATILGLPMGYVRTSSKDHGRQNQIEGKLIDHAKIVVIEDLILTAGSAVEVVEVLRKEGAEVLGIASIFTYGMRKATDRLAEHNVRNVSASDYDTLLSVAVEENYIKESDVEALLHFRDNPSDQSWMTK